MVKNISLNNDYPKSGKQSAYCAYDNEPKSVSGKRFNTFVITPEIALIY